MSNEIELSKHDPDHDDIGQACYDLEVDLYFVWKIASRGKVDLDFGRSLLKFD